METNTAYLSLGSNLGDRTAFLAAAMAKLRSCPGVEMVTESQILETPHWPPPAHGKPLHGPHLNQVLQVQTTLAPLALLAAIKQIEKDLGRKHREHWGDREIDIDILLYGSVVFTDSTLTLPHAHLTDRMFVLQSLLELAPNLCDPRTQIPYHEHLKKLHIGS